MKNSVKVTGMSLNTILFIVFLVLKLTDNIDWSWWWVFAPIWVPFAAGTFVVVVSLLVLGIRNIFK
jgi:hypothetical protein